ncbi:2Fe-2S iron-sulfur cluster-binding protein, partial [Vibrio vulnificus]
MSANRIQKVDILRYDPATDAEPRFQAFEVPFDETMSVLDALGYVKDHLDKNLSYRWSCRMAI